MRPGCKVCYAERIARRLYAMGQTNHANGFPLTVPPHSLDRALASKKPQTIFEKSMSDPFYESVHTRDLQRASETMRRAHWH